MSRAKIAAWRCETMRRMKPICSSRMYVARTGFAFFFAAAPLAISVPALFRSRRSQGEMRVADIGTRVELGHGAAEADAAALDDIGAVGDQPRKMQVLLGHDHADSLPLHGLDGRDHLLDDLRR